MNAEAIYKATLELQKETKEFPVCWITSTGFRANSGLKCIRSFTTRCF